MPCPNQFFCDFQHDQQRLFSLEKMDERHPRVLSKLGRIKVGQEETRDAHVLSAVAFPEGGDRLGERALSWRMGDHPGSDVAQIGQRRSNVKTKSTRCHGDVRTRLVGKVANANGVGPLQELQTSSFGC